MIRIALFLLLCVGFSGLAAQKNLVFSQALLVSASQTVPAGRVWKIENVGSSYSNPQTMGTTTTPAMLINGTRIYIPVARTTQSTQNVTTAVFFPIWLPAGTTVAASNGVNWISVLEFIEQTP